MKSQAFISKADTEKIVKAIESAELNTSGEIRVHIEGLCPADPVGRAVYVFNKIKMYKTRERNGVLIYIAHKSKKFAIIGDSGINAIVPPDFWNEVKESLGEYLRKGEIARGLSVAIGMAGDNLKKFFPYKSDDINEQSNEISFGE